MRGRLLEQRAIPAGPNEDGRLGAAQGAGCALRAGRPAGSVQPRDRDPVVVEDALGAVDRVVRPELLARRECGIDEVVELTRVRVAEPVDAAVALVAGGGAVAARRCALRPELLDLGAERDQQAVREAGRAAGVVRLRQVVEQVGRASPSRACRSGGPRCASARGSSARATHRPNGRRRRSSAVRSRGRSCGRRGGTPDRRCTTGRRGVRPRSACTARTSATRAGTCRCRRSALPVRPLPMRRRGRRVRARRSADAGVACEQASAGRASGRGA